MTANPQWREIQDAIPLGSHWKHHQDIVARVFYMKLKAMMDLIVKNKLFGEVLGFCYRIEWQARGMPHAHILIILKTKIVAPRHIDEVVWAEIPCPVKYPILHEFGIGQAIQWNRWSTYIEQCQRLNFGTNCGLDIINILQH